MSTNTVLNTFKIAKGTKAQILTAYNNGDISSTDFAIATDEDYVTSSELSTVATSGSYNDLTNKPTIPTVNNATLTIQKNGTTVNTFTANASSNVTANITVPTQASDIGAQDTLVSGTNIKTINNESILGSGNVTISPTFTYDSTTETLTIS